MDIYGAFQLCSIGVLAAPLMARVSDTYFFEPGRNVIFLWTGLVLAGLLSLTVEFDRIKTSDCTYDSSGPVNITISNAAKSFPYNPNNPITCGLPCTVAQGPVSPMRQGSANNIYVIPAPYILPFGEAMLLSAACCIPAILSLIFMWSKIRQYNWMKRFGGQVEQEQDHEPISGTNGATVGTMKSINEAIGKLMGKLEILVYGGAVIAILVVGEWNFFTRPVFWQTEPIASIGQWAPIVGTVLALLGSLYLIVVNKDAGKGDAGKGDAGKQLEERSNTPARQCSCPHTEDCEEQHRISTVQPEGEDSGSSRDTRSTDGDDTEQGNDVTRSRTAEMANRAHLTNPFSVIGHFFSDVTADWNDESAFRRGPATNYPVIPGEEHRNENLSRTMEQYSQGQDNSDLELAPVRTPRSRSRSSTRGAGSSSEAEGSAMRRVSSPQEIAQKLARRNTLEVPGASFRRQSRRDTLDSSAISISSIASVPQVSVEGPKEGPEEGPSKTEEG